ncbi:MAG TPA: glycosyltransferase family A protein, partial [Actinomycetes bacterium]
MAHTVVNLRLLRRPGAASPADVRVSVLLPVRDEAGRAGACLRSLLGQRDVPDLEIVVLDDGSTDGTVTEVREAAGSDPRVRLVLGGAAPPPPGWTGKSWACQRLADEATGSVYVYVDADVRLEPDALAATVSLLRSTGLDLVCPYPRQVSGTVAERLVQPLLQWSWLTTLPLRAAERSPRASLAAANGQLLAIRAEAYRAAGGHAAVGAAVLDDIELLRAVKRSGGRGVVIDGTHLATCRMYDGWGELEAGYTKSLWAAFGSPAGAVAVTAVLATTYVLPAAAALLGSRTGAVGYLAGVAGRAMVARRVGGRVWPDSLAHPVSVALLCYLTGRSLAARR